MPTEKYTRAPGHPTNVRALSHYHCQHAARQQYMGIPSSGLGLHFRLNLTHPAASTLYALPLSFILYPPLPFMPEYYPDFKLPPPPHLAPSSALYYREQFQKMILMTRPRLPPGWGSGVNRRSERRKKERQAHTEYENR